MAGKLVIIRPKVGKHWVTCCKSIYRFSFRVRARNNMATPVVVANKKLHTPPFTLMSVVFGMSGRRRSLWLLHSCMMLQGCVSVCVSVGGGQARVPVLSPTQLDSLRYEKKICSFCMEGSF